MTCQRSKGRERQCWDSDQYRLALQLGSWPLYTRRKKIYKIIFESEFSWTYNICPSGLQDLLGTCLHPSLKCKSLSLPLPSLLLILLSLPWRRVQFSCHRLCWHHVLKHSFDATCLCECLQASSDLRGFPDGSMVKNPPANAGDSGSVAGSRRSPREGNGNPLQFSCLGSLTDREEPGGLHPMVLQRVGPNWVTEHARTPPEAPGGQRPGLAQPATVSPGLPQSSHPLLVVKWINWVCWL